jgi:release factor glutamine methyltransferase
MSHKSLTISDWLVEAMVKLQRAGVPNGRRDAIILLADQFNVDKSWVHSHPETELSDLQRRELNYRLKKRVGRTPLAYIRGFSEFYGRQFLVNSHVLIPRPESEAMITMLRELHLETPVIADIGSGSGCLAITAAIELPDSTVHGYDLSPDTLVVAKFNASSHHAPVRFYQSNLLRNLRRSGRGILHYDAYLVNLPYVPAKLVTSPEITREPSIAIFSGLDGLDHYRRFWKQVAHLVHRPKYILVESLEEQQDTLEELAFDAGYALVKTDVLIQLYRLQTV